MIALNHRTKCFLFAFALSLAIPSPLPGQTGFVNVRDYGASGSASHNATTALRKALAECARQGGGTVYVPPGQYTTGAIELKDNVSLELEAGARILMSQDPKDYAGFPRTVIYANKAKNIGIRGKGTVDGLARYEWGPPEGSDVEILEEEEIARKAGVDMRRALRRGFQGYLIHLVECDKVTIQDINVLNSTLWAMHIWGCNGVVIHGIDLSSSLDLGVNSDGIDLNCTSNVLISDSRISTGDDAICIKTGPIDFKLPNLDPSRVKPSENIVVTNCILSSSSTPLMIGTETAADIRHVTFSNCVIRGSNKGLGINIQDGAHVSDILYSNITMNLYRRHWNWWGNAETFYFVLKKRFPESPLGSIKNIVIDNVISHAQGTSRILAPADGGIENITISNLQLFMEPEKTPDKRTHNAVFIDGAKTVRISNLRVRWDETRTEPLWRSALYLKNVTGLEIEGFSGRQGLKASSTPAILLENIIDGLIRNCRADEGTGAFFDVKGEKTRRLHFRQNDLAMAREKKIIPAALTAQIQDEDPQE